MEDWPITLGDITVLLVLLLSGFLAFARGFVREALSIGAWVGAALITVFTFDYASELVEEIVSDRLAADFIAGVVIFLLSLIALSVGGHYATRAIRASSLNMLDRSLGFVFGLLRGVILIGLGYLLLVWLVPDEDDRPDWIVEARTLPLVEQASEILLIVVPEDAIDDGLERAEDALDQLGAVVPRLLRGEQTARSKPDAPADEEGYNRAARDDIERLLATSR